jgi:hypothetical protein
VLLVAGSAALKWQNSVIQKEWHAPRLVNNGGTGGNGEVLDPLLLGIVVTILFFGQFPGDEPEAILQLKQLIQTNTP